MASALEQAGRSRFACTSCGLCCNRSPEVLLSEAAALADTFVFRLMFRLYVLPRSRPGRPETGLAAASSAEAFYQSKRLLASFAARRSSGKIGTGGKASEHVKFLLVSALSLDTGSGACSALSDGRCSIYERRPLACRSVPFHYSRPEASAASDLEAFVARPGYGCDTGPGAPIALEQGRIVDPEALGARGRALEVSAGDKAWQDAILREMKNGSAYGALPGLREIEENAAFGVTTVSMRIAWQIAAAAGVIDPETCRALIETQAALIDRELGRPGCPPAARETLIEMRAEYRRPADGPHVGAAIAIDPARILSRGGTAGA